MLTDNERHALFPITRAWAYLDTAYRGPLAGPAKGAMLGYLNAVEEGASLGILGHIDKLQHCLKLLGAHLNVDAAELVFLANATDAFSRIALGIDWREGDEVVAPANDYPGLLRPLLDLRRRGVRLRLVPGDHDAVNARALLDACGPRTRLIAASHVNFRTGYRLNVGELCPLARKAGVLTAIDCVQSAGWATLDLRAIDCDFATLAARKWLCSVDALGWLYVRTDSLDQITPHTLGLFSVAVPHNFDALDQPPADGARRFMLGVPSYGQVQALGAMLELHARYGQAAIEQHTLALAAQVRETAMARGLAALGEGWSEAERSPIVCLRREGPLAEPLLNDRLLAKGVVASVRQGIARVSPHWFNTASDIDRLFDALSTGA